MSENQKQSVEGWMERFDDEEYKSLSYEDYGCDGRSEQCCGNCGGTRLSSDKVKHFISQLLSQQQLEVVEKVKEIVEDLELLVITDSDELISVIYKKEVLQSLSTLTTLNNK